ncbi:MAG: nucleotidyltransferase family protein [Oscillospiraceae bacterium]|nr:nucleotidyltransferase family protein [Oscillospiraceae bacterium]
MKKIGVICEYNPFHNGHKKQLSFMKLQGAAICLMSGNYVQRGEPAILNKYVRAAAAVACGADLVLELPVTYALRSAEGFAAGGVEILNRLGCVDALCFGSESGSENELMQTAKLLLTEQFAVKLRSELASGVSFPCARQNALEDLGGNGDLLENPNDILAVEYCKAILQQGSGLEPMVLTREGSYHDSTDAENPSASMLRTTAQWERFVPAEAMRLYDGAPRASVLSGERAWLARLRFMSEREYSQLPFGSEGLWRKLMHACREQATLEDVVAATKSKRYTRTRLMRMLLCACLGITGEMLAWEAPYVRVLALNETGRKILREAREVGSVPILNAGEHAPDGEYAELERRASDLYGLFAMSEKPLPPSAEARTRVVPVKSKT